MKINHALTCTLAGALALAPVSRATADTGSFVAGAAIGGLLGHLATRSYQKNQTIFPQATSPSTGAQGTTASTGSGGAAKSTAPGIPATQTGRDVQSALNFFGFDAGSVDGQVGRQTREAISQYQSYLGYPVTGQLTGFEQDFLVESHQRAAGTGVAPGSSEAQGMLKVYMAGLGQTDGNSAVTQGASRGLPTFQVSATPESLADHCAMVAQKTQANGGYLTVQTMQAPVDVLHEQFCMARTEAIGMSHAMATKVADADSAEIATQCAGFGPVMAPMVTGLATEPRQDIIRETAVYLSDAGADPAQMIDIGEICLGVGYETDDMGVALGSALVLVALGQGAYGELVGHHLAGGFGTPVAPGRAVEWYDAAFDGLRNGQAAVFDADDPSRITLLQTAVDQAYDVPPRPQKASQPADGLPTFSTGN